jgi:hypothetical protein
MKRRIIASAALALAFAPICGSCQPLDDQTLNATPTCFSRSQPTLPRTEAIRPFLSNGESGRRIYDAVIAGDVDTVGQMVRADPQLLATHRVLQAGERASNGNVGGLLTFAVARCDAKMVGALLELGIDPDGVPPGTALTYAALADDPVMAVMLLQAGASPDAHAETGSTPLREVLYFERADAVRLLARAGADVNRADAVGGTPLEAALMFGDYLSADELMHAGANPWQVANKGRLPAAMLLTPASNPQHEAIRERLLAAAHKQAPVWPPPGQSEIVRQFVAGAWPTPAMREAGFVASPQALASMRQVAKAEGG